MLKFVILVFIDKLTTRFDVKICFNTDNENYLVNYSLQTQLVKLGEHVYNILVKCRLS